MKPKLILLLGVLLSSPVFSQQSGWFSQNEDFITSKNIRSVHQFDVNTAIVVGADGLILKTTNGGSSFMTISTGRTALLNDVFFISAQIGWAVGASGEVIKSTDGGASWTPQTSGSTSSVLTVHFIDANTGWIAGADSKIRRTTDGGASWNVQYTGSSGTTFKDIQFRSATFGLAVGYIGNAAYMFRTTDGGITWTSTWLNSGWGYGVYIINENIAWGVGETARITTVYDPSGFGGGTTITNRKSVRWKTTDGGQTWTEVGTASSNCEKVFFVDQSNGWAAGMNGIVLRTTDAGATWYQYSAGSSSSLLAVHFMNTQAGYVVGENGLVSKTTDGGITWTRVSGKPTISTLCSAFFLNSSTGWIGGSSNEVLKSTDGGTSWRVLPTTFSGKVNALSFSDASTGCAAVSYSIYRTTDGGLTWPKSTYIYSEVKSLWFVDPSTGYGVGASGKIVKTTNGGVDWQTQTSGVTDTLTSAYFVDASTGWAAGANGKILKTTNGGAQWIAQTSGATITLRSIRFADAVKGFAVGDAGTLLATTDGGAQWVPVSLGVSQALNSIHFSNATTGWIAGASGVVLKTTDCGSSWGPQTSGTTQSISAIVFADISTGWIVGSNGLIMKTTDGGGSTIFPPSLFSPANRVTGLSKDLQLSWNAISGAQSYRIQVSTSSSFSSTVADQSGVAVPSLNVSSLLENTIYYWRVKAEYGQTSSDWSTVWCFATGSTGGWNIQISGSKYALRSVYFVNERVGWGVGDYGTIVKTTDGGVNWNRQTSTLTYTFSSVQFRDTLRGWLLAERSYIILKTTNGGTSWERSDAPYSELYGLCFADDQNGWAAGLNGTIVKTTNGGTSWTQQTTGQVKQINSIHFVDALFGWAAGYNNDYKAAVLRTTDGGTIWTPLTMGSYSSLNDIRFVDRMTGFAVGEKAILKTTDGGNTWSAYSVDVGYSSLNRIRFLNSLVGWTVGGSGKVFKTADGGRTWGPQSSGCTSYVYDIHFVDASKGWMVGGGYSEGGVILQSLNGGGTMLVPPRLILPVDRTAGLSTTQRLSWSRTPDAVSYDVTYYPYDRTYSSITQSGISDTSYVLSNLSPNTVYQWVVVARYQSGVSPSSQAFCFATAGTNWKAQICPTSDAINNVCFTDESTGWAVGGSYSGGEIFKTTDGGGTWNAQQNPSPSELSKVQFIDKNKGWVLGGIYGSGFLLLTSDGGTSWTKQTVTTGKGISDLYFINAQTGWCVGESGMIYKTSDGGVNWFTQTSGTSNGLSGVHFVDAQTGWAVGSAVVLKTTDGGSTWLNQSSALGALCDIHVIDVSTIIGLDAWGSISRTTDGGATWSTPFSNSTLTLRSVSFADAKNGWVAGPNGVLLKTTDGGKTWGSQVPETQVSILTVFGLNASTAWIAGSYGSIIKTTNGGGSSAYLPAMPILASPTNNQVQVPTSPTLRWNASSNATSYDLEVSTSTTLSTLSFSKKGMTDTSCVPTGLQANTKHYWRVKANNAIGSSEWSSIWAFTTTMQTPTTPTLSSPTQRGVNQSLSPTLTWSAVTNAQTYHVQLAADSLFASMVVEDSLLTAQFKDIGPLQEGRTYYWRVRARNAGGASPWSTFWSFTTKIYLGPPIPVLLAPVNSQTELKLSLLLQWASSRNATSYRVQLAVDQDFATRIVDKTTSDTVYSVSELESKKSYYWRVSAINSLDTSPWSTVWIFATARIGPPKPTLVYPANAQSEVPLSTTLRWGASSGATGYELQVSPNSDFQVLFANPTLADTSYSISGLGTGNAYYWRVRATDNTGTSPWSQVFLFSTGGGWKVLAGSYGNIQTIRFISPTFGWMGNSSGGVYVSTDRGVSWIAKSTSYATTRSYCFLDTSIVWMCGLNGLIKRTTDGGKAWITQVSHTSREIKGISFSDANNGWAVADSVILRTTDGGSTWISQPASSLTYLYGVKAISSSVGIVLNASRLMRTTDGGALWTSQPLPGYAFLQGIHFIDNTTGWITGADGALLKTTDGGSTWKFQLSGTPNWLTSVHFVDPNIGWAVGWNGTIIKTTDGGETWGVQRSGSTASFYAVYALDASSVFAGGGNFLTTGAGGGMTLYPPLLLAPLNGAKGASINPVLSWTEVPVVRYRLQVQTYSMFDSYSNANVVDDTSLTVASRQVASLNKNSTYYWRVIAKTSDGLQLCSAVWSFTTGSSSTSVEDVAGLPDAYFLHQNYPNPFNPSTRIQFDIPHTSFVTLKVYSALGVEVTTLISSELSAGRYEVAWNAGSISTGVYFCRMQAGEFVMTKKLILLK